MIEEFPYYDTRLRSDRPAISSPTLNFLNCGEALGTIYRSLLLFKLNKAPASMSKAILSLFWSAPIKARKNDTIVEIYRPSAWTMGVGWNQSQKGVKWKKQGGDWYDKNSNINGSAPFASVSIKASDAVGQGRQIDFDITELVKGIQAGKYPNTGLLIKARTENGDYIEFNSLESKKNEPKITYIETVQAPVDPPVVPPASNVMTISGTGSHDSAIINTALETAAKIPGTIVHLSGPFVYDISDSIMFLSGSILEGEDGVILKLAKDLPVWGGIDSIPQKKAMFMIRSNQAQNVTIRNLTVDGSQADYYPNVRLGTSCFNMATLLGCKGLTIQNVTWKNGCNDAMLISGCDGVTVDACQVDRCGHDGVYAYNVKNITVKNCNFKNRTNSSTRFDTVTNGLFQNNECSSAIGGYGGLELENRVENIDIDNNFFHDLPYAGIVDVHSTRINVNVRPNNRFVNCGKA